MSLDVKRVPLDFAWPQDQPWPGYAERRPCPTCKACGNVRACKTCHGAMVEYVFTDPPEGPGYQLWEMRGGRAPASPVFAEIEDFLRWCAENETFFADFRGTVEDWRKFTNGQMYKLNLMTGELEWALGQS